MKKNLVKWINKLYTLIHQSIYFWFSILTKGFVQTSFDNYVEEGKNEKKYKMLYDKALSFVWFILLVNIILASTYYVTVNQPLLNFLTYICLLVFIVITVFISWLSYLRGNLNNNSDMETTILAFHSMVRFWSISLSLALFIFISIIIGYSNLIVLICILPGIYFQLSKLLMERFIEKIKEIQTLLNTKY
ncbi:hypothetical protein [Fundicoccus ignavus]|uniref:Uncharacterized protein n=1 Tax=Fundicoccus ignavus TaxID=2664442 RepID=A0A844BZR3_9LACT|nr:hypothetical protein [Fundicoccus ignavus]MRJ46402.1 hypothetical protein [Fundicoccus ignavus]